MLGYKHFVNCEEHRQTLENLNEGREFTTQALKRLQWHLVNCRKCRDQVSERARRILNGEEDYYRDHEVAH